MFIFIYRIVMSGRMCHSQAVNGNGNQAPIYRSFRLSDESKTETLDSCINSMMEYFFSSPIMSSFLSRTTSLNFASTTQARRQDTNLMLVSVPVVSKQPSQIFLSPTHQLFLFFLRPHFPSALFCYFCDAKKNILRGKILFFRPQVRLL